MKIPKQKTSGIPLLGLGTWKLKGNECYETIQKALDIGYRHIDTADIYHNHKDIGQAIQHFPRNELYIVSKVYLDNLTPSKIEQCVPRFLDELKTDYLDLILIHWPSKHADMIACLKALEESKQKGLVKNIGVSNFVTHHLKELDPYHLSLITNQIELHPYLQRKKLVKACEERNIGVTAYRPLAKGAFENDQLLMDIGKKYGKSPSQIVLNWIIKKEYVCIPKASNEKHLRDNINIFDFELSSQEIQQIDGLDSNQRYCTPDNLEIEED